MNRKHVDVPAGATRSRAPRKLYFEDFQIGDVRSAGDYELSEDEIIAFAQQWDPQPWHVDRAAALRSPMRGITASSCHTYAITARLLNSMGPVAGIASLKHELELPSPARPGDRLSLTMTCVAKRASRTKPDRGLVTFDMVLANQAGVAVLKTRSLMMIKTRSKRRLARAKALHEKPKERHER